jgi:hypothetical protein
LALSVKKKIGKKERKNREKEKKRKFVLGNFEIGIDLIRVGRHSGWMFSGLIAV